MLSKELELCILRATNDAKCRRHEMVSIEHLFLAMLSDNDVINVLKDARGDVGLLRSDLDSYLANIVPQVPVGVEREPEKTDGLERLIKRTLLHAHTAGKILVTAPMVIVEMYKEEDSYAVFFLLKQEISREDLMRTVSDHDRARILEKETESSSESDTKSSTSLKKSFLDIYAFNLNQAAKKDRLDALIGRDKEVERAIQILCRRKKNNPIIVGEPGVGKTAIVEGLASMAAQGKLPPILQDVEVFALDLGGMLAGTKFRGDFELRLKNVIKDLKSRKNAVLFIDEIHTLIGAGSTSGSSVDASNILKPLLSNGELRCIGATTFAEYRNVFSKDSALARRFQKIEVMEPSVQETYQILLGLRSKYEEHYKVKYTNAAIKAAAALSEKYIHQRFLPDKAIDVLDEAGAYAVIRYPEKKRTIGVTEIEKVVSLIARVPIAKASKGDAKSLQLLEEGLKKKIFGQDQAIKQLVTAIKRNFAGLKDHMKPIGSFLLAGSTGVGKTELCRQLSSLMGMHFARFDMSEYMEKHSVARLIGSPPGYVGYEQGGLLTEVAIKHPHAVILLDEIEKAHFDIYNILLQVMDYGKLTDNNGQQADFRNVVIFMTSNVGSKERNSRLMGFSPSAQSKEKQAVEKTFTPEFRNRLDAIVHFSELSQDVMEQVVDKFIEEIQERLATKKIKLHLSQTAKAWLAEKGFSIEYGAREMGRLIQTEVSDRLSDEILFGKLQNGGDAYIDLVDEKIQLSFQYSAPTAQKKSLASPV